MTRTETLRSRSDDTEITLYRWEPEGTPRFGVVIAHGLGEHALRYDRLAGALAARGACVWAPDQRGHGRSPGPGGLGDFGPGGWEALVADLADLVARAEAELAGAPLVLLGHSMGSLAAQQFVVEHDESLAGLVLSGSTCFDLLPVPEGEAAGLEAFNAPFEPARTPFDWLSRDPAEVDRYVADPLCGFDAAPEGLIGMLTAAARIATPEALAGLRADLPVLLLAGDADPLNAGGTLIDALSARWQAAGVRQIDRQVYPAGRHEMLNEVNREAVTAALLSWISERVA